VPAFIVYQIENGHLNPSSYTRQLVKLAKVLSIPFSTLRAPCQLTAEQMAALEAASKAPRAHGHKRRSNPSSSPAPEPQPQLPALRTAKHQVQKLGIALTYEGQIIGAAQLNLDTKALTPLIRRLLREALSDE
jgi:hypothetical protein